MAGRTYEEAAYGRETPSTASMGLSALGLLMSMGLPVVLIVWGMAALGPNAIEWASAIVWGLIATVPFTLFGMLGQKMGMTEMDILDLLGSMVADPGTGRGKAVGATMHHMNGAILGVSWAYGVGLVGVSATWATGLWWGVLLTVLALIMMSGIGPVHPAVRAGTMRDPGPAATNFGKMTPLGSLMGHLVYGLVLGLGYQLLPLG